LRREGKNCASPPQAPGTQTKHTADRWKQCRSTPTKHIKMKLNVLDNNLTALAKSLNGSITVNDSKGMLVPFGYEERSIRWSKNGFNYLIQIFPEIKKDTIHKWIFWACCFQDTVNGRYWKKKTLIDSRQIEKIISDFDRLSSEAVDFLEKLSSEDLDFAVKLKNI